MALRQVRRAAVAAGGMLVLLAGLVAGGAFVRGTAPEPAGLSARLAASSMAVAPYVDMTNGQEGMLDSAATQAGLRTFTAAFVIGTGCTPIWGDTLPVSNDPTVSAEIAKAQSEGAQVIVSFGGAAAPDLADSCADAAALARDYQSVVSQFHLSHIDFDVEGFDIANPSSIARRFQAIKSVESANPGLSVSTTIPVLPTGLDADGQAFIRSAASAGVRIDVVNVMAMDYYGTFDSGGANMGAYAIQAAQNTLAFLRTVQPGSTYANVGVTPMIGRNDDGAETFTEADAQSLVSFARSNGLGRLAFWSVDRDQPCSGSASGLSQCTEIASRPLDYTRIFQQYAGGGPPPPTPRPTPTRKPTPTPKPTPTHRPPPTPRPSPTGRPPTPPPPPPGNLVTNPGFESGLAGWSCASVDSVVTSPVHSGGHALAAAASNSDDAQCTQTIAVRPGHTYRLSAWVQGGYPFIGVSGTGTSDTNTFLPSASSWQQLSMQFTTGGGTTSVTIYVHGWYGQGTIYADDFAVS